MSVEPSDPATVLGVAPDAGAEEIRAAYLRRVREHPPDRSPEQFQRIREAYETLSDPRRRMAARVLAGDPDAPLSSLVTDTARCFLGPEAWLEVLREAGVGRG